MPDSEATVRWGITRADDPAAARNRRSSWAFVIGFSIIAALFVGLFVAAIPVGFGLDEEHHTYRAWQVSRGQLEPSVIAEDQFYGGDVPTALVDYVIEGTDAANAGRTGGEPRPWTRHDIDLAPDLSRFGSVRLTTGSPIQVEEFTNAGASSFLPYLPAAVGMRLGTVLDLDIAGIVLTGKLFNGAVYVAMASLAMVLLRTSRWRWLAAIVALLPLSVFQASVLSADTFSNGASLLFVCAVLALRDAHGRASWPILGAGFLAAVAVVAAKPTYVVLLPLIFAVPNGSLASTRTRALIAKSVSFIALVSLGGFLSLRASDIAGAIRMQVPDWTAVDPQVQLSQVIFDPIHLVGVLARTVVQFGSSWVEGATTMMGTNIVFVPEPFTVALLLALLLAALQGGGRRTPIAGAYFVVVAGIAAVAVVVALYLTFTVVGAPSSNGVQGRYWIPLLVPLFAGLGMLLPIHVEMSERTAAFTFGSITVAALVAALTVWCWTVY